MSKGKNHNSILFLTTIGVYLGLVLVGGTAPQVFAHSASTRNFEITEEIEFADDLDKDPDGDTSTLAESLTVYLQDFEIFLRNLQKLQERSKVHIEREKFEVAQSTLLPCVPANMVGSYTAETFINQNIELRPALEWFSKRLTDGYSLADCLPSTRFNGSEATESRFQLKLDDSELFVQVAVRKQSRDIARLLRHRLGDTLRTLAFDGKNAVRQRIYERTSFKSQNNQVFVVTRLPRADLASLLATNAK